MRNRRVRHVALVAVIALTGCSQGPGTAATTTSSPGTPSPTGEPTSTPTIRDILELPKFAPLEPGTYFIDPDLDPSTSLRVMYEVPADGWSQWFGAVKFGDADRHVLVNITTVVNVVRHGCRDHSWADPPVGPSVDDLAYALADLAPFRVTSPPKDVTIYGYIGKHLELTVPDLPVEEQGGEISLPGCKDGRLWSWGAPIGPAGEPDAFSAYTGSGYTEEFWILDVDETRLMIAAARSAGSPPEDVAELQAILDSIRIEP